MILPVCDMEPREFEASIIYVYPTRDAKMHCDLRELFGKIVKMSDEITNTIEKAAHIMAIDLKNITLEKPNIPLDKITRMKI